MYLCLKFILKLLKNTYFIQYCKLMVKNLNLTLVNQTSSFKTKFKTKFRLKLCFQAL
jgi:hypothetical protein